MLLNKMLNPYPLFLTERCSASLFTAMNNTPNKMPPNTTSRCHTPESKYSVRRCSTRNSLIPKYENKEYRYKATMNVTIINIHSLIFNGIVQFLYGFQFMHFTLVIRCQGSFQGLISAIISISLMEISQLPTYLLKSLNSLLFPFSKT